MEVVGRVILAIIQLHELAIHTFYHKLLCYSGWDGFVVLFFVIATTSVLCMRVCVCECVCLSHLLCTSRQDGRFSALEKSASFSLIELAKTQFCFEEILRTYQVLCLASAQPCPLTVSTSGRAFVAIASYIALHFYELSYVRSHATHRVKKLLLYCIIYQC